MLCLNDTHLFGWKTDERWLGGVGRIVHWNGMHPRCSHYFISGRLGALCVSRLLFHVFNTLVTFSRCSFFEYFYFSCQAVVLHVTIESFCLFLDLPVFRLILALPEKTWKNIPTDETLQKCCLMNFQSQVLSTPVKSKVFLQVFSFSLWRIIRWIGKKGTGSKHNNTKSNRENRAVWVYKIIKKLL